MYSLNFTPSLPIWAVEATPLERPLCAKGHIILKHTIKLLGFLRIKGFHSFSWSASFLPSAIFHLLCHISKWQRYKDHNHPLSWTTNTSVHTSIMNDSNKRPETNMWPGFGRSLCGAALQGKQDCRLTLPCAARRLFRMATSQHSQSRVSLIGIAAQWWPTSNGHHSDLRAMHPAEVTSQSVCVCVCLLTEIIHDFSAVWRLRHIYCKTKQTTWSTL